jgi:hypothetical protein
MFVDLEDLRFCVETGKLWDRTTKRKNLQVATLVIQTDIFSLSLSISISLPLLPLPIPLISLYHWGVSLSTKTSSFRDVGPVNQEITAEVSGHVFCHVLKLSPLNSPLKSRHFLSEVGPQSFDRLTLPVLLFI